MRYHLESTLPIHAFQPLGGRHNPFKHGMTLEGGGGGIISSIGDAFSGVGDALSGVFESIDSNLVNLDKTVGDVVPGGWATVAAIAVPYAAPYFTGAALTAGQAAALSAGTRAATGAIKGEDPEDILKGAALAAAGSYGLSSLGGSDVARDFDYVPEVARDFDYIPESVPLEKAIQTSPEPAVPIEEFGPTDTELGRTEMSDIDPTRMEGVRSLVAESGVDPMSATGGRFDPFIGVNPTSNIYTDLPVGYEFMGPNGMEIVGPNGKTYLQKDLYNALSDLSNPQTVPFDSPTLDKSINFDNFSQNVKLDARPYILDYDPQISAFQPADSNQALQSQYETNINDLGAGTSPYGEANELSSINELVKDPFANPRPNFLDDPLKNISNRTSDALEYVKNAPENAYKYLRDTPIKEMGSDLYDFTGRNLPAIGLGALALSSMGGQQPQPQGQPATADSRYTGGYGSSGYTGGYGSSGGVSDPYLLRNRINAANIYNYRNPYTSRYAEGGEVKHFALGGISNAITRFTQPIEKAIIQPIGQALPFLKDVAPYAGILAAPFIASPFAAAGVGALSSGFGRPGTGFDMKRALMGGIAAYGASTVGAGLEAAGQENYAMPDGGTGFTSGSMDDAIGAVKESPKSFFRDTDAMQKGVGNLLGSDSKAAAARFGTEAGVFKSGVPLVMGTSGMMAIDEASKMREEAERSAGVGRQEQADMLARISKGRKRAEDAVRANPYMYAMGGSVDDELGGDYSAMGMDQGNMQKGLFGLGYAAGGMPSLALSRLSQPAFNEGAVGGMQQFATGGSPRFLSGGGDGMSDSIPATIGGTQEARLADGEFVIPADVVSHLGNGSSKAGAKQLYSMMDRVRKARTGNEKQGRQIKPNKMMPA